MPPHRTFCKRLRLEVRHNNSFVQRRPLEVIRELILEILAQRHRRDDLQSESVDLDKRLIIFLRVGARVRNCEAGYRWTSYDVDCHNGTSSTVFNINRRELESVLVAEGEQSWVQREGRAIERRVEEQ